MEWREERRSRRRERCDERAQGAQSDMRSGVQVQEVQLQQVQLPRRKSNSLLPSAMAMHH